jgi:hypothetical protein
MDDKPSSVYSKRLNLKLLLIESFIPTFMNENI